MMKKLRETAFIFTLCLSLLVSFAPTANGLSDIQNHWAKQAIEQMVQKGAVSGYSDGTFKPNKQITRAEFMSMINKSFGYSASQDINFRDVKQEDWYYNAVASAVRAGYIGGYEDNTMRPNNNITREEAAVIIKNILSLSNDEYATAIFTDHNTCTWSKGSVGAVAKAGIINGYTDGTFQPKKNMTRAEASVVLKSALAYEESQNVQVIPPPAVVNPPAVTPPTTNDTVTNSDVTISSNQYGPSSGKAKINGDVTVTASSTTIQNTHITGNLIFDKNAKGPMKLNDVTVDGTIKVNGNTNINLKDSSISNFEVRAQSGTPKITAEQSSSIQNIYVYSNAAIEENNIKTNSAGFKNVYLASNADDNSKLTLSGNFDNVEIAAKSNVQLTKGSIESLLFTANAEKTTMTIDNGTTIQSAVVRAKSSSILGNGTIKKADIRAEDVTLQKKPNTLTGNFTPKYKDNNKDNTYTVEIKVTDSSNKAISGAKVTLSGVSGSQNTGSNGIATFSNVKNGTYTVTVSKSGYANTEKSIKVSDKNYDTTVKLDKGYTAEITVYESNGTTKISNATVTIDGKKVTTNSSGVAKFTDLSAKTYSFTVEKSGYQDGKGSVTVKASSTTSTASVKLSAASGYTVNVTVKDTSGTKISDAKVTLSGVSGSKSTNTNGVASFTGVKNGSYTVTVTKSGYADSTKSITVSSKQVDTDVQLSKGYQAQITVTEANGTTKISGASVTLNGVTVPTNAQGVATFNNVPAKAYTFIVKKAGYADITNGSITVKATTAASTASVKMTKVSGQKLTLTVVDSNNNPISGALVTISSVSGSKNTGSDGKVTFENLSAGTYSVTASKSPFDSKTASIKIQSANKTDTIKLTGGYEVTLTVKDDTTQNAITTANVKINNQTAAHSGGGKYSVKLPPKNGYSYTVSANGYDAKNGTINVASKPEELTVYLVPKTQLYTVTVKNTGTGTITASNISLVGSSTFTASGSNGTYKFENVPAGSYRIVVKETSTHEGNGNGDSISVSGNQEFNISINKIEQIENYTITFSVNVSGASITFNGETKTASGNSATFNNVPAGSKTYEVTADGYKSKSASYMVSGDDTISVTLEANTPEPPNPPEPPDPGEQIEP